MKTQWLLSSACIAIAALLVLPVAQADRDDDDDDDGRERIVGTWRFTGFAPGAGEFSDYLIFHDDNTLTERSSFDIESVGSGVWKRIGSNSDSDRVSRYAAMFETFRDNDGDGFFDSRTRARITVRVVGNRLKGTGTIEFRTLEDNQLFFGPFPGATFEAKRMKLIRE